MLKIKYQIDNIPLWFKPFYYISTYLGLWLIVFYRWIIQKTCTIIIEGQEFIDLHPSRIEAIWHYRGSMYWLGLQNVTNHVQFSHPLWFMYKIILALRWHGCKVVIGSTGHGGRRQRRRAGSDRLRHHQGQGAPFEPKTPTFRLTRTPIERPKRKGKCC